MDSGTLQITEDMLLLLHDHMRQVQLHLSEHRGVSNNNVDYHILESNTRTHTHINRNCQFQALGRPNIVKH